MSDDIIIYEGLRLPAPDIEALLQGRLIVAISDSFINRKRKLALYSTKLETKSLSVKRCYHQNFLYVAETAIRKLATETNNIKAWAEYECCSDINRASLAELSKLTIWTQEYLEERFTIKKSLFILYLRVHFLSQLTKRSIKGKKQFSLLSERLTVSNTNQVLTKNIFAIRKRQLAKLEPPQHPELEELLDVLSPLSTDNSSAKQLQQNIHNFLGWSNQKQVKNPDSDLIWINKISELGDRSQEEEKKSDKKAGTDFEDISRKALEFIGFKVDKNHKGDSGCLDLYCLEPYPLVIECKSGKSIKNLTVEQLLKLGGTHLGVNKLLTSHKLVIAPNHANPTLHMRKAADKWKISIIKAMSLQKLAELNAQYPGSINLIKLKIYLEAGVIDHKIQEYIDEVKKDIELRSRLLRLVKHYIDNSGMEFIGVEALHGAYSFSQPLQYLKPKQMHEILIELSSPLTGYLGRIKGTDWKTDKFYFLRDL